MINILETITYSDPWSLTFYYIAAIAILIGLFWTYIQVFVKKPKKKKMDLKENVIYQHEDDMIEKSEDYYEEKYSHSNKSNKSSNQKARNNKKY